MRYPFEIEFQGHRAGIFARHAQSMERFDGIEFREYENLINAYYERDSSGWTSASLPPARGRTSIQPPGVAPFLADFRDASIGLTFRPMSRLLLDETYIYSHLGARTPAAARSSTTTSSAPA